MTTLSDPGLSPFGGAPTIVNYEEPPHRTPPALVVGPLAWIRENLFSSNFNTLVTLIGIPLIITLLIGFIGWVVTEANWFVINFNLRQFMVGRYEVELDWRPVATAAIAAGVIGMAMGAFSRPSRRLAILIAIVLGVCLVTPMLTAPLPLPVTYLAVGDQPIESGSSAQPPIPALGFIGRAGETLRMRVASPLTLDDSTLSGLSGFADNGSNLLRGAAFNRLRDEARIVEIEALLASDLPNARTLTANQRAALETERERLTVSDPVVTRLALNSAPVTYRLLYSDTFEVVAEGLLQPYDPVAAAEPENVSEAFVEITLPSDGWYVLEKSSPGYAIIETYGIYPHLERNFTVSEVRNADGEIIEAAGRRIEYLRMTDSWVTSATRPRIDGRDVPMAIIIDTQYRGERTFNDWLKLYLAPFLSLINLPLLYLTLAGAIGFFAVRLADRLPNPAAARNPRGNSQRLASYALTSLPVIMFILIYGLMLQNILPVSESVGWNGGLVTAVLLIGLFVLRLYTLNLDTASTLRGSVRRITSILLPVVGVILLILIYDLLLPDITVVPISDTRRWGGLLLTILLSMVGIIASFPLGVLLALGRRSTLPVVSAVCTIYIEFVRGVPLITVLFMAQLLVPLVNPSLAEVDNVFRVMIGITLFSAAYLAENVRGGLQAIPPGQEEAARALGLAGWQVTLFVTLPQALRVVIPALVGQFISLFKDTSLVAIVGLTDLTGIAQTSVAQTEFLGARPEAYLFIGIVYFAFCYVMAAVSRRLEASGSGAARRV